MKNQYNMRAILTALLICGAVGMFNETSLNIALTNLIEVFQISPATAQWLTTGFMPSWYFNASEWVAVADVFHKEAVHRFGHEFNRRYIDCGTGIQF